MNQVSWDPNTGCHFLFNPKLNSSWLQGTEEKAKELQTIASSASATNTKTTSGGALTPVNHAALSSLPSLPSVSSSVPSSLSSLSSLSPSTPSTPSFTRRWKRELLHSMSSKIHCSSHVLSKQDIVKEALDIVCRVTSSERATVYLVSEDGTEVVSFINKDPRQHLAIRVSKRVGAVVETVGAVVAGSGCSDVSMFQLQIQRHATQLV